MKKSIFFHCLSRILFVILLLVIFRPAVSESVVIVIDEIDLYLDGYKLKDNSVIIEIGDGHRSVCEYGKCSKSITKDTAETVYFYKTGNKHMLNCFSYARPACDQFKTMDAYELYLNEHVDKAIFTWKVTFSLPNEEEKAVEPDAWVSIGRCFNLELSDGVLTQKTCVKKQEMMDAK
ncbi:MAG: hypothetical protein K8S27_06335 [Candidatus Omnitrophica bacterium]|nr:hypothetical protein [Candidatus Omnitrophota bacterium]